jgi:hypothetical protein
MATATQSLARSTAHDAIADTSPLRPSPAEDVTLLKQRPRWRTDELVPAADEPTLAIDVSPDDLSWERRLHRTRPYAVSFLASVAVHLVLLLAAAFTAAAIAKVDLPLIVVQGGVVEDFEPLADEEVPIAEVTLVEVAEPVQLASVTTVDLDAGAMQGGSPEIELDEASDGPVRGLISDRVGLSANIGSGQASTGNGDAGGEAADGDGTEFFGVQASGKRFVFVCDCSRSMAGAKWGELNVELIRCLGDLAPDRSFYVIFFDGEMHPMFEPSRREPALLDATQQNIDRARFWISSITLGANTSPYESVKFGAEFTPDAMFLLTDGEFSDYTAPYLRGFNKDRLARAEKKIPVHTIGFYSEKDQLVLKRIAKDSGGKYKFIKEPHVPRPKRRSWNVVSPSPGTGFSGGPAFGPAPPRAPRGD